MTPDQTQAVTGPAPAPQAGTGERLTRAVLLRLSAALTALGAGMAALVVAIDLIRSTLS